MSKDLQQNASLNFLGIILCFNSSGHGGNYSVKNITSGLIWSDHLYRVDNNNTKIVLVPRSIFSISDGDERIELTSIAKNIIGIDLLYKWETTTIDEYDSSSVNLQDERSNSSDSDLEIYMDCQSY